MTSEPDRLPDQPPRAQRRVSFKIGKSDQPVSGQAARADTHSPPTLPSQPWPGASAAGPAPALPRLKQVAMNSHRHEVNPALAIGLLGDIQAVILTWQDELRQVVSGIHALYDEGPIVDGWLETCRAGKPLPGPGSSPNADLLRHGDTADLMDYVETLEANPAGPPATANSTDVAQYRFCCLDEEGKIQSQLCPPAQLTTVSTAIARHQKLRQLLSQKQYLEAKLKRAVTGLTTVRDELVPPR
ncbi:hypothetical protein IQ241_01890 [Romeria aff. gracilis LEGE 07310]|uniref:Uncharacterized protein n=1 Tax=Vasconcelosia minhoensis LEGE 07310 TaxID=915328 RepID=A0A8J7DM75_9CYAN|nr:hypothetical protein [Romeria gracilis]MBE9076055.1 hypothetical protein [Romeria aff. gracilis LEGE 07310]